MYSAVFLFLALITHADDNFDCIECATNDYPECEECGGRRQLSDDCKCVNDDAPCEECGGRRQLSDVFGDASWSQNCGQQTLQQQNQAQEQACTAKYGQDAFPATYEQILQLGSTVTHGSLLIGYCDNDALARDQCFGDGSYGSNCIGGKTRMCKSSSSMTFNNNNCGSSSRAVYCVKRGFQAGSDCDLGEPLNPSVQCTYECESLTQTITTPATGGGTCSPDTHQCVQGEGSCGATECTIGADSDSTIAEILDELTCLCDEHKATGWLREDREPLTPTLQALIVLLKNAPTATGISPGRKFLKRWNRLIGRAHAVTHEIEHNSEIDRRIWRKGCRAVRVRDEYLDIWADKFD